ncbi:MULTISPECIES: nuclear transport factor 2 family protein [unclassified Bradyrhizobium]|uniref:nuclear transport factor 2 family protein n=1 Tax=unclassified Bradyrhizobium TaxID=2631580 RepID=UPI001AED21FC|nr:nuclear transport factor 2 family protein [Bradyrhizobium sp. 2S1]MCK7668886.1 nuclear transport factor 2 family protein [Bradyrhizobium sp. 2S1]
MSDTLGPLMQRNLHEVFGQPDSARRAVAIAEIYTANCTFFEAGERIVGRDALNAKIERILQDAPGFVFRATGSAEVNHDLGRLRWYLGPAGSPPVVTGMDVAIFEHGRIRALYTFLDKPASD